MPEQPASAGGRASRAPPQVVVKAALDHVARRGREGCTFKEIWDECEVGCDSALKAFLWRALRRQRKYVFCRKTAVARPGSQRGAIKGEKNCKAENWEHAPLNAEELDSLSLDAWDSVMVIASEDHRLRALGALHASDLPEETHGTEILEILAASKARGLTGAEVDAEAKGRGLKGATPSFLLDRLVGQGHVKKTARLVPNPPGKPPGNKRVLFSRLSRDHYPERGQLIERARTHDRVVDYAREALYGEQGKTIAQRICQHFSASLPAGGGCPGGEEGLLGPRLARTAREVRVGLEDVARLLRLDGPSAQALVRATQYRDFDARSALRVVAAGGGDEGGTGWEVIARPPTSTGSGAISSGGEAVKEEEVEEDGREGGLEGGLGGGKAASLGPWQRPLPLGNVKELDEVRQMCRLAYIRGGKGVSVPDVERLLGLGSKRANRLLTMLVNRPAYGLRASKVTHGRTAAYCLLGPAAVPAEVEGWGTGEARRVAWEGRGGGDAGGRERANGGGGLGVDGTGGGGREEERGGRKGEEGRRALSVLELMAMEAQEREGGVDEEMGGKGSVERVAEQGRASRGGELTGAGAGGGTGPGEVEADKGEGARGLGGNAQPWHKTFTGLRRRRMEMAHREVVRAGCLRELDVARLLRDREGGQGRQIDRKSVRRLLGDLEEQRVIRLVAVSVPGRHPVLVVTRPDLDPGGPEVQALVTLSRRLRPFSRGGDGMGKKRGRGQQRASGGKAGLAKRGKGRSLGGRRVKEEETSEEEEAYEGEEEEEAAEGEDGEAEGEGGRGGRVMEDEEEKGGMFEQGGAGRLDGDGEEDEDEEEEAGEEAEPIDVKTWRRAEKDLRVLQRAMPRIEYLHDMLWQHAMAREAAVGEGGGVEGREGDPSRAAGLGLGAGMGPADPPTAPRPPVAPVDLSAFFAEMPVGKYVRVYGLVRVAWTGEKVELLREHVAAGARMRELPPVLLAAFFPEEAVSAWGKILQDMLDHLRILEVVLDAPQGTGEGRDAAGVEGYRGSTGQSRQWAVVGKDTFTRELQIDLKVGPEEGGAGVGMRRDGRKEGEGLVGEGGTPDWCSSRPPWAQTLGTIHVKLEVTLVASVDTNCLSQAPTGLSSSKVKAVSGGGGAREERADQEEGEDGTGSCVEGKPAPGPRPVEPPARQRRKLSFDLRHAEAGLLDLKRYWETLRTLALGERPSRQVLHAIQIAPPVATGLDAESGGGGAGKEGGQDRDGPGLPVLDGSGRRPLAEERTRFRLPDPLLRLLPHLTQTKAWAEKARNLTKKKWPRRAGLAGARAAFGACLVAGAAEEEAEDALDVKRARRGTSRSEAGKAVGASEGREWEAAALADELHEADGEGEADTEGEEVAPPPIPAFMPPVPSPAMATSAASSVLPLPPRVPGTFPEAAPATRVPAKRRKTGDMGDDEESFGRAVPRRARAGSLGDGSRSLRSEQREGETAPARPPLLDDEFDEALMEAYVRQRAMYGSRLGRKRTPEVLLEVEELVGEQGAERGSGVEGAPGVDNTDRVAADGRGRLSADGGREGGGRCAKVGPPRGRRFRMQWEAVVEKTGRPRMACLRRLEALLRSSETATRVLARLRAAQRQEAGQWTESGDREACYAAIQDTTPSFAATLVKVKQGLAVAGDPSLVRARRRALAGLPAEAIRRSFRELWDDGWLVEESCQVPGGGEENADRVQEEDGGGGEEGEESGGRREGEGGEEWMGAGSGPGVGTAKRTFRQQGTLTLSRRFDDAMMKGAALYPQGFFRALGPPRVERTSQDVGTWPSGAVCGLVESFGHAVLGPHGRDGGWRRGGAVSRAQDIWPGRRFLDLDIAPRQQGASPLLGRGFVTEPLSRVSVTLGGPETLAVEEGATEELEGAVNILMWGQETWRPADGEEGEMEDRREERLPEGFAELISLVEKASVDGVSFQDLCRDMASIRAALQEGVTGLNHEGKPDDGIGENLVRSCLDEGIRRGHVLRVPSFFGPRFVSRTQATPWMMVAAPGSATDGTVEDADMSPGLDAVSASGTASIPDHSSNRRQKESFPATRLALPWLTIPDGQLHVFLLLRALRSLIAAIHTHPGMSWTAVRSDYLPMFSFSEVLLLLRACVAARVLELKRVRQGRRASLWEEGRRRMVACLGPDWKYFDDLQARPERRDRNGMGGDKEGRDERGEEDTGERDVLVAFPGVQSMTRLGSLEAAIRAAGPKSAVSSDDYAQEDKNRNIGLEGM